MRESLKKFILTTTTGIALVGVGVCFLVGVHNDLAHYDSLENTGHKVVGKIVDRSLETHYSGSGSDRRVYTDEIVTMSYEVAGKTYTIVETDTFSHEQTTKVGTEVNILTDKENPADARTERDNEKAKHNHRILPIGLIVIGLLPLLNSAIALKRGEVFGRYRLE